MSDLEDAIREHLELKRRRGADPSEVAREEEDALAPVTRSHPVVATGPAPVEAPAGEQAERHEHAPHSNGDVVHDPSPAVAAPVATGHDADPDVEDDATQEFHVDTRAWLEDD